ncbi:hypothetical protein C8Q78DRAFT_799500 [Trametes maxima]|nr:hypothetical protein C8Q78DRAFT_799500 [Trametes maxima]
MVAGRRRGAAQQQRHHQHPPITLHQHHDNRRSPQMASPRCNQEQVQPCHGQPSKFPLGLSSRSSAQSLHASRVRVRTRAHFEGTLRRARCCFFRARIREADDASQSLALTPATAIAALARPHPHPRHDVDVRRALQRWSGGTFLTSLRHRFSDSVRVPRRAARDYLSAPPQARPPGLVEELLKFSTPAPSYPPYPRTPVPLAPPPAPSARPGLSSRRHHR